ncbi:serine/threonine-protein phosphatase, partial [Streptomyces sp. NPDC049744]
MDDLPSGPDARARLELTAIRELLKSQRRRIHSYARIHRPPPQGPVRPTVLPATAFPSGREVLDA